MQFQNEQLPLKFFLQKEKFQSQVIQLDHKDDNTKSLVFSE